MTRTLVAATLALVASLVPRPAAAHIVILEPNGGEVYSAGEVVSIRWCIAITHDLLDWDIRYNPALPGTTPSCTNVTGGFEPIELDVPPTCTGPGGGGICFLDPDPPCCMEYLWTVPDGIDSDQVKIKIKMDNSGQDYFDLSDEPFTITPSTSVPGLAGAGAFTLEQNEPNPFRPSTSISFVLETGPSAVRLAVHDARGALVKTLLAGSRDVGRHRVSWNGADESGRAVAAGIYFYRLESGDRTATRRMVLLR